MPTLENQTAHATETTTGHAFSVIPPPAASPVHASPASQFRAMAIAWLITMLVTLSGFVVVATLMGH